MRLTHKMGTELGAPRSFPHSESVSRLQKPPGYLPQSNTSLYGTCPFSHTGIQGAVRQLCALTSCQLWDLGEYLLLKHHLALTAELKHNGHSSSCWDNLGL